MLRKAEQFAWKAHEGQFRKDRVTPYFEHCKAVVALLKQIGVTDETILAAAWLHDVVEDCGVSIEEIKDEFNSEVARIVSALTRDVSRAAYKERIRDADFSVQIIKLADMVHNCSELTPCLPWKTVQRKVEDYEQLYSDLAKKAHWPFYLELKNHLREFVASR